MKSNKITLITFVSKCVGLHLILKLFAENHLLWLSSVGVFGEQEVAETRISKIGCVDQIANVVQRGRKHPFGTAQNFPGTADLRMIWVCWSYSLSKSSILFWERI